MRRVFISWSGDTLGIAEALSRWLGEAGAGHLDPWISSRSLTPGIKWSAHIDHVLQNADGAVVCLGPEGVHSPWVLYEIGAIGPSRPVIPVLFDVEPDTVPEVISQFQHVLHDGHATVTLGKVAAGLGLTIEADGPAATSTAAILFQDAVDQFRRSRLEKIKATLAMTGQVEALLMLLGHVARHPGRSPRQYAKQDELQSSMGKKNATVLAIMLLSHLGLLALRSFNRTDAGQVFLTRSGETLLAAHNVNLLARP